MATLNSFEQFTATLEEIFSQPRRTATTDGLGKEDLYEALLSLANYIKESNAGTLIQDSIQVVRGYNDSVAEFAEISEQNRAQTGNDRQVVESFVQISEQNSLKTSSDRQVVESIRDAGIIQPGVYETEALGRAAVADGQAFKVQGSGDVAAYEYRRTNSTTSALIATYPSSQAAASGPVALVKATQINSEFDSMSKATIGYLRHNLSLPLVYTRNSSSGGALAAGNLIQGSNNDRSVTITGWTDLSSVSHITDMRSGITSVGARKIIVDFTPSAFVSVGPSFGVGFVSGLNRVIFLWRSTGQLAYTLAGTSTFQEVLAADASRDYDLGEKLRIEIIPGQASTQINLYIAGTLVASANSNFLPSGDVIIGMRGSMSLTYSLTHEYAGSQLETIAGNAKNYTDAQKAILESMINGILVDSINLLPNSFVDGSYYRNSDGTVFAAAGWKRGLAPVPGGAQITISGIDTEFIGTEFDANMVRIRSIAPPQSALNTYKSFTWVLQANTRFLGNNINSPGRPDCSGTAQIQLGPIAKPYEQYGKKYLSFANIRGNASPISTLADLENIPKFLPNFFISYEPTGYNDGQQGSTQGQPAVYVYVKYAATSSFYARYRIAKLKNDLIRADCWKITGCDLYKYNAGVMEEQNVNLLTPTETEFVWREGTSSAPMADFTGGYHGDEIVQDCTFYVDSIPLAQSDLLAGFSLRAASEFWYIQKSEMYKTQPNGEAPLGFWDPVNNVPGIGADASIVASNKFYVVSASGVLPFDGSNFIAGQSVVAGDYLTRVQNQSTWTLRPKVLRCLHKKRTDFGNGGFRTFNRVEWKSACTVLLGYFGLVTVARTQAEIAYTETLQEETITGTPDPGVIRFSETGSREINYFNKTTKLGAKVTSRITKITKSGVDNTASYDSGALLTLWDVVQYAKYYRALKDKVVADGDVWEGECTVKHFKA